MIVKECIILLKRMASPQIIDLLMSIFDGTDCSTITDL